MTPGQASARAKSCSGAGAAEVEVELRRLVVDGRHVDVNFDEFHHLHYYLRFLACSPLGPIEAQSSPLWPYPSLSEPTAKSGLSFGGGRVKEEEAVNGEGRRRWGASGCSPATLLVVR